MHIDLQVESILLLSTLKELCKPLFIFTMNLEDILRYEVGIDNMGDVEILVDGLIVWDYKVQNGNLHLITEDYDEIEFGPVTFLELINYIDEHPVDTQNVTILSETDYKQLNNYRWEENRICFY